MTKEPTTKELEQKVAELKDAHEQLIIYARELKEEIKGHKKAKNALTEERERFEQLVELSPDGVILVQDGKILLTNHSFIDLLGYADVQDLIGQEIVPLFDVEFRDLFTRVFDFKSYDLGLQPLQRGIIVHQDKRKIWVATNSCVITWKKEPVILTAIRNITKDVLREAAIREEAESFKKENIKLRSSIKERYRFGHLIGKSAPMQKVYELILKAATTDANIIVLGESGTGKELVASAIHEMSDRADKPFVTVNCGAISANLTESAFFGHRKGAFTGAEMDKDGYFHTADQGTLFLDEVGEISLNIQAKLLRVIETGEYTPVGDTRSRKSDTRIIFATNRNLADMVKKGLMREDFYYRISVIPIGLPLLKDRKEDLPLLIEHFLQTDGMGKTDQAIPGDIMDVMNNYDWPGNVRELRSVIRSYLVMGDFSVFETSTKADSVKPDPDQDTLGPISDFNQAMQKQEKRLVLRALSQYRWHRAKTAAALKMDPKTLYTKMKKLGIT